MNYFLFYVVGFAVSLVAYSAVKAKNFTLSEDFAVTAIIIIALFWPVTWLMSAGAFIGRRMR